MKKNTLRVSGLVGAGVLPDKPDPAQLTKFKDEKDFYYEKPYLIPLDKITPNPFQPRRTFPAVEIEELAKSIAEHGLIQPIAVRFNVQQETYQIIAGERRYRAFKLLGKTEIPTAIFICDDSDLAARAIVENVARKDLSDYELGKAIRKLIVQFPSKTQLAEKCGIQREDMYRYFAFEVLPEFLLDKLNQNPWLFGRNAASDIKVVLSKVEGKEKELALAILSEAIALLEKKELDQTKIGHFISAGLKNNQLLSTDNLTKRDEFIIEGRKIGYFSSSPNGIIIKFSKGILDEEKKVQLQSMISEFLEEVINSKNGNHEN